MESAPIPQKLDVESPAGDQAVSLMDLKAERPRPIVAIPTPNPRISWAARPSVGTTYDRTTSEDCPSTSRTVFSITDVELFSRALSPPGEMEKIQEASEKSYDSIV